MDCHVRKLWHSWQWGLRNWSHERCRELKRGQGSTAKEVGAAAPNLKWTTELDGEKGSWVWRNGQGFRTKLSTMAGEFHGGRAKHLREKHSSLLHSQLCPVHMKLWIIVYLTEKVQPPLSSPLCSVSLVFTEPTMQLQSYGPCSKGAVSSWVELENSPVECGPPELPWICMRSINIIVCEKQWPQPDL